MAIKIDSDVFLDDFEVEAKMHIDKIESSFLEADSISNDPKMIDSVFRAAHSLKGTAGFFSLKKIVAVAHELESVFSQIKGGNLAISDDLADVVMQSVDCLRDLVDNIQDDGAVEVATLIESLKKYAKPGSSHESATDQPFDFCNPMVEETLKRAVKRGHRIYYVKINFNRGLRKFYQHPERMLDGILSIGSIVEAIVNGKVQDVIREADPRALVHKIKDALSERDTSTLELLVTSVLEFDLFSIAIEIDQKHIHPLSKEAVFGAREGACLPKAGTDRSYKQVSAPGGTSSIHLDLSSINGLVDLANEMILTRNRLNSNLTRHEKKIPGITPILQDMNRLTSEIQERVMLTRMQPISMIFGKFPRIIRDTARALGKDIEIEICGGVMLDKYLLDALTDPITQLVKNAADHGVESAARRAELGKPQKGRITLNAFMRDSFAIIEVTDDGAGIDAEILKRKGLERGVITEDMLPFLSENDVFALIFEPGFSTAKQVTNLSGRGVGMDIVQTNIRKLGGTIEIVSKVGQGTTVRLKMPLTLSVLRTIIVTINDIQYAVPEINVERVVRIRHGMPSRRLELLNHSLVLSLDGRIIPFLTIEEIDAKAREVPLPAAEALLEKSLMRDVSKCLVLKTGDKSFAFSVDDVLGTEQTLVKPLPEYLKGCPCYSNVTVLGNGNAITILNAEGILRLMGIEGALKTDFSEERVNHESNEKQYILFKSLGPEYYALETVEISRIEKVEAKQIQEMGNGAYVNIAGKTVRIIKAENFVPVKMRCDESQVEKLHLLTLKNSSSPVGLLAIRVLDKVEGSFKLANDQILSDYIFGTSTYDEKVLIFLNPTAILEEMEMEKQREKIERRGEAGWRD